MPDTFSRYHPLVNFVYFALVFAFSMVFQHPACLLISLTLACVYAARLNGKRALRFALKGVLPLMLVCAAVNPLFNHRGMTILWYFPGGNPLTMESIAYGFAAAAMLAAVMTWFSCFHRVFTSDKFIYLFGRVIPGLSLVLSMTLRFVPRFRAQLQAVTAAQKCVGRDPAAGGLVQRARRAVTVFSIMVTWALENGVDTADSMKSRGYGLPGRSAFSIYRLTGRDKLALTVMAALGACVIAGGALGWLDFHYFPALGAETRLHEMILCLAAYALLCALPVWIDDWEDRKWKRIQSNI